jgi:hypothetical protein
MHLDLTPTERKEVIDRIIAGTIEPLLTEYRDELDLLSPAQVGGILDVSTNTLKDLEIPRITLIPGKIYRYRASAIKQHLKENEA